MGRFGEVLKRAGESKFSKTYSEAAMPMASELLPEDGGFLGMGFFAFAVERSYAAEHDGLSYTISWHRLSF